MSKNLKNQCHICLLEQTILNACEQDQEATRWEGWSGCGKAPSGCSLFKLHTLDFRALKHPLNCLARDASFSKTATDASTSAWSRPPPAIWSFVRPWRSTQR